MHKIYFLVMAATNILTRTKSAANYDFLLISGYFRKSTRACKRSIARLFNTSQKAYCRPP